MKYVVGNNAHEIPLLGFAPIDMQELEPDRRRHAVACKLGRVRFVVWLCTIIFALAQIAAKRIRFRCRQEALPQHLGTTVGDRSWYCDAPTVGSEVVRPNGFQFMFLTQPIKIRPGKVDVDMAHTSLCGPAKRI
jgi:hypothetical protein